MSLQVGELYATLTVDKSKFSGTLSTAEKEATSSGGKLSSIFQGVGMAVGMYMTQIAGDVLKFGESSMKNAEALEQAQELVKIAFKTTATAVEDWANTNSVAMGVNNEDLENMMAKYGVWAKNVGMSTDDAAAHAEDLATRAREISEATGSSFDDVFSALQRGEQGATKGLKQYGVAIDNSAIQAEALKLGLIHVGEKMTLADKAAATHALIMQQTAQYTQAAADMSDTMAVKEARLGAVMDQIKEVVGGAFVTIASKLMDVLIPAFTRLSGWFEKNGPAIEAAIKEIMDAISSEIPTVVAVIQPLIDGFTTLATYIGNLLSQGDNLKLFLAALGGIILLVVVPPMVAWAAATVIALAPLVAIGAAIVGVLYVLNQMGVLQPIITEVTKLFGEAMDYISSNVIPDLQAAFDWFVKNVMPRIDDAFDWFSQNVVPALRDILEFIVNTVFPDLETAFDWFVKNAVPPIEAVINDLVDIFDNAFSIIMQVVQFFIEQFTDFWHEYGDNILDIIRSVLGSIQDLFQNVLQIIQGIFDTFSALFKGDWGGVWNGILEIFSGIWNEISSVIKAAFDSILTLLDGAGITGAWNAIWNGISSGIGAIWDGITGTIKGAINLIIGLINDLINALDTIQVPKFSIPNPLGGTVDFGGFGINIPTIPYLAGGTPWFAGGLARVGEQGAETVLLPQGSKVLSNGQSRAMGGGASVTIGTINGVSGDEVERQVTRGLRRANLAAALHGR